MIKVCCRTNLDGARDCEWPDKLPCVPRVGDFIESSTKFHNSPFRLQMEVVRVTYKKPADWFDDKSYYPEVELGLPKRWRSIKDFYDFFEPLTGKKYI